MGSRRVVILAILTVLLSCALSPSAVAQSSNTLGTSAAVNCGNFLPASEDGQQHAQAVFDADPNDPYGLDGPAGPDNDTSGEPGIACETESDLGTAPPASCQDFLPAAEGGQGHAQALFDSAGNEDPYALDPDGNGVACDGGGNDQEELDGTPSDRRGSDQENMDGPPPDSGQDGQEVPDGVPPVTSGGTNVVVSVAPLDDFDDLEARLDARFAALEAQFAAFEVRAENGFGRFDESGNDASNEAQGSNLVVSTAQRPADNRNVSNEVGLAQQARGGEMIGADVSDRRMARKDAKLKPQKVRKTGKRDGHKGRQRSRR